MEQQTLIILAIVFVALMAALGPNECDCTTSGASTAPAMSAYLKPKGKLRKVSGKNSA